MDTSKFQGRDFMSDPSFPLKENSQPMVSKKRVVITGMGVISPLGLTLDDYFESLARKKSGVKVCPDSSCAPLGYGAPVTEFTGHIDDFGELDNTQKKAIRKGLKLMSREIQMSVASAQRALHDAGVACNQLDPLRVGTSIGSDLIITTSDEVLDAVKACLDERGRFDFSVWGTQGLPRMNPLWQLKYLPNMPASHIAIYNDFRGPSNSITLREASIGAVIGESAHIIQKGIVDAMLVGGTGSRIHPVKLIHALQTEQVAQEEADPSTVSRPFDASRCGTVLGEGAASLFLESEEHALKRGAKIYAEVVAGNCLANIGPGLTPHRKTALIQAMRCLFEQTGTNSDQVGHVNAHGLSTYSCDIAEARAISEVFGKRNIPVTALKSYFGNLGAGGGAIELIADVLTLQKNRPLFPILNNSMGDPDCPIHAVRDFDTPPGDSFVKLAVSPQGQASAVLIRKYA